MRMSIGLSVGLALLSVLLPRASFAAEVTVTMGPSYFAPSQITVNAGDTVVWRNTDSIAHTVTANDGRFDSGTIQPGSSFLYTFTSGGSYSYHCTFHNGMIGTVSVVSPTYSQQQTYGPPQTYSAYTNPSTAEQLRAQAQALLARVQQLQAQLTGGSYVQGNQGNVPPGVSYDSSSCPLIGRSLKIGSSGDDVTRLQQFLARDPSVYPEGNVTGYYGSLTQAAVQRWQTKYNIVSSGTPESTGFGVVGPRTASAIAILCTTGSYGGITGPTTPTVSVGGFIQVTPIAGDAPLDVSIQATINTVNACTGATYLLEYGDGSQSSQLVVPTGNCAQMVQTLSHQYRYAGTYLVTLSAGGHRTSATVQVYGTKPPVASAQDSVSASPSSGNVPLSVKFTGTINGSGSCSGGSYSLDFGDNNSTSIPYPADGCRPYSYEVTHSYTTGGNFIARLYPSSSGAGSSVAQASVSVSAPTPPPPPPVTWGVVSITPAVGGNPFAISTTVQYAACAAYTIDWGDGSSPASAASQTGCSNSTANATANHTYAAAGNYTISLKDGSNSVRGTAGVVIR